MLGMCGWAAPASGQVSQRHERGELPAEAPMVPPELLVPSDPEYPPAARAAGLEATVVLRLEIDETGRVRGVEVAEPAGHGFDEAALRAANGLEFSPALRDGRPVPSRILFRYEFAIEAAPVPMSGALAGRVLAAGSGAPLADAELELSHAGNVIARTRSDERGAFEFPELAPGQYELSVRGEGFSPQTQVIGIEAGHEAVFDPMLASAAPEAAGTAIEVTVHGERTEPRAVTHRKLERRELARVAGNRGDALAALENMPGVARSPALSGLLIVRGTAPQSTQIFVDGTYVPNMYHFGGLTSVLPTDMLEHVDFFSGNYGARFGRGVGGVVDIGVRRPRATPAGLAQVDLLDARIQAEGPLPGADGWRFIGGVRRSHVDAWLIPLLESQDTSFQAAPVYYDYQAFVEAPAGKSGTLRLGVFGSDDRLRLTSTSSQSGGELDQASAFWNIQSIHETELAEGVRLKTVASAGYYRQRVSISTVRADWKAYPLVLRSEASAVLDEAWTLHGGLDFLYAPLQVDYTLPEETGPGTPDPGSFLLRPPRIMRDGFAYFRPGAFVELAARPVRGLELTPGLRLDYSDDTGRWDLSPRLAARYQLSTGEHGTSLKGGVGFFHEPPQIEETLEGYGSTGLRSIRALSSSLGVEQGLVGPLSLSVEGFVIDLDRVITRRPDETGRLAYDNSASGSVVGGELLLRYDADDRFFGWLSYTLSRSRRRWAPGDAEVFFDFDQTHVMAAVGSYRPGAGWELGVRVRAVSGNPFTPCVAGAYSAFDSSYVCINGPFQSERAQAFFQLDVRAEKSFALSESLRLVAYLEIINATAREGRDGIAYSFDYSQSDYVSANLPLLPNLGVRGEFQ